MSSGHWSSLRCLSLTGALLVVLSGCAALCDPTVVQIGPDTFRADGMCGGQEEARGAGEYCRRMGKEVLVTSMRGYGDYGKNQTVFRCLSPYDPEYRRPNYQSSPDVIIQDNRR